jgi:hypothetical protein
MKRRMSIGHLDEKKEKSSAQLVTSFYFHSHDLLPNLSTKYNKFSICNNFVVNIFEDITSLFPHLFMLLARSTPPRASSQGEVRSRD